MLNPMMVYRLDRFGRGGHHRPFCDQGFPGVRIMEAHEHYDRQHQDIRIENGRAYGDVIEGVDKDYAAQLTAVNVINLASLASAPPPPSGLMIGGVVQPSTMFQWDPIPEDANVASIKIYWRSTTAPQWEYSRTVSPKLTQYTLENVIIDNFLFGVATVSPEGHESIIEYPMTLIPRR